MRKIFLGNLWFNVDIAKILLPCVFRGFQIPKNHETPQYKETEEKVTVPNEIFEVVFEDLLERYNFTVREDTEFEQEVAIDPEMLGTIFEELILGLENKEFKDIPDSR